MEKAYAYTHLINVNYLANVISNNNYRVLHGGVPLISVQMTEYYLRKKTREIHIRAHNDMYMCIFIIYTYTHACIYLIYIYIYNTHIIFGGN